MIRDLLCGTISGVANCLSGYIFDTLKVKIQMNPKLTMMKYLKQTIANKQLLTLFDGIYYPLITVPVINAVVFGSYQFYKKITGKSSLSFWDGVENGAFAGFVNTIVVSPVQLVKCKMQVDQGKTFTSSQQCLRHTLKNQGTKGIFKGSFATVVREVPSYSAQFATYQILKDSLTDQKNPNLTFYEACLVGALAGTNCWLAGYPQDIIKTKLQVSPSHKYPRHKYIPDGGFISCGKQIYNQAGIKGFFYGLKPCLVRAVVANAFGIAFYEKSQELFGTAMLN